MLFWQRGLTSAAAVEQEERYESPSKVMSECLNVRIGCSGEEVEA